MNDEIYTINLNNVAVGVGILCQIATALETHGSIKVLNAAIPANGPGLAAMILGNSLPPNSFGQEDGK